MFGFRVKKFLLLLSMGFAISAADSTSTANPHPKQHRGFYNSMDFGLSYIDAETRESGDEDYEINSFSGFGFPLMEFRFGVGVANFITFYTQFNFALYLGSGEERRFSCDGGVCEERLDDSENLQGRTYVGFGTSLYPFRDTSSVLNGFFFGGSSGYSFESLGAIASLDYAFTLEVGKEWWVSDEYSIGVSFSYFQAFPQYDVEKSESPIRGFYVLFRITRG